MSVTARNSALACPHGERYKKRCSTCQRDYQAAYRSIPENRRRHRRGQRAANWRRALGISYEEGVAIYEESDGLCAVCYERPARNIDHDHDTGEIRGAVCQRCNQFLSVFDRPDIFENIVEYLANPRVRNA